MLFKKPGAFITGQNHTVKLRSVMMTEMQGWNGENTRKPQAMVLANEQMKSVRCSGFPLFLSELKTFSLKK